MRCGYVEPVVNEPLRTLCHCAKNLMKNGLSLEYIVLHVQPKEVDSEYFCIVKTCVDSVMIHLALGDKNLE